MSIRPYLPHSLAHHSASASNGCPRSKTFREYASAVSRWAATMNRYNVPLPNIGTDSNEDKLLIQEWMMLSNGFTPRQGTSLLHQNGPKTRVATWSKIDSPGPTQTVRDGLWLSILFCFMCLFWGPPKNTVLDPPRQPNGHLCDIINSQSVQHMTWSSGDISRSHRVSSANRPTMPSALPPIDRKAAMPSSGRHGPGTLHNPVYSEWDASDAKQTNPQQPSTKNSVRVGAARTCLANREWRKANKLKMKWQPQSQGPDHWYDTCNITTKT